MKLRAYGYELQLRHVFRISRGAMTTQPTLIVALEAAGHVGYGEATANEYYGNTIPAMVEALRIARGTVESADPRQPPADLWDRLAAKIPEMPSALCAIDQAAHDLWGKLHGKPVHQLWELDASQGPLSNFTIGIDEPEVMVQRLQEYSDWPIFKIKLGTDRDLDVIARLRQQSDAPFRIDANCGWGAQETIVKSRALRALGVEFIEQPLPAEELAQMPRVLADSALPLIADENCVQPEDVAKCDGAFHGINIKLVKCGGLTPARRMIAEARQRELQVMVGCMTESTVGISAIAQLLPLLDYVDMDGAALLASDIADGVEVRAGRCHYPDLAGSGVSLRTPGESLLGESLLGDA